MSTQTYITNLRMRHSGTRIPEGGTVELTDAEAESHLAAGNVRRATAGDEGIVTGAPEAAPQAEAEPDTRTRKERIRDAVAALVARGEVGEDGKPVCALVAEEAGYSRVEGRERDQAFLAVTTVDEG